VVFGDADGYWYGDYDGGIQAFGHSLGQVCAGCGVVPEGKVFQVLLDAADWDGGGVEAAGIESFPEFLAGHSFESDFI